MAETVDVLDAVVHQNNGTSMQENGEVVRDNSQSVAAYVAVTI